MTAYSRSICLVYAALLAFGCTTAATAPSAADSAVGDAASDGSTYVPPDIAKDSGADAAADALNDAPADADALPAETTIANDAGGGLPAKVFALGPAQALFDPLGIHEVAVTLSSADWKSYLAGVAKPDSLKTYAWYTASVVFDGQATSNIGVSGYGNGSQISNPGKPNMKLKFDHVDNALVGPEKQKQIRLKASGQDGTFLREPLAGALLRSIGGNAPRFSWAHLTVNGEDFGFYQLFEAVDKRFFSANFGNKDGSKFETIVGCQGLNCPGGDCSKLANDYEGDPGATTTLAALATEITTTSEDQFAAALADSLYVDEFLADYAVDAVLSNLDGLASAGQNFTFYADEKTKRLHLIATGTDLTFGYFAGAWYPLEAPWGAPNGWCKNRHDTLFERIWANPTLKSQLLAKLRALQCGLFAQTTLVPIVQAYHEVLTPWVYADPKGIRDKPTLDKLHQAMVDYIGSRQATLAALLGACP